MQSDWRDLAAIVSYTCGILYFFAWSASFYPQPTLNYKRQSTRGLTPDFPLLNVLGFTCYTISTVTLLLSSTVRAEYARRHPRSPEPTVRLNDAAFGVHAFILCIITYSQFWPKLWRWKNDPNAIKRATITTNGIIVGSVLAVFVVLILVLTHSPTTDNAFRWSWLDLIYCLQYIKLLLTFFKYLPQAIANFKRKSTAGWSVSQIQLDFAGGILSLLQLVIDSSLQADWSGLTGNPVKFGLANISLAFDIIFMTQHFVLYGPVEEKVDDTATERDPLLG